MIGEQLRYIDTHRDRHNVNLYINFSVCNINILYTIPLLCQNINVVVMRSIVFTVGISVLVFFVLMRFASIEVSEILS